MGCFGLTAITKIRPLQTGSGRVRFPASQPFASSRVPLQRFASLCGCWRPVHRSWVEKQSPSQSSGAAIVKDVYVARRTR